MNKLFILTLALLSCGVTLAEESTLKEGAKEVGQKTGEVVHKIGEGGKVVGKKVAEVAVEVGHATRDGAKEFAKAVKNPTGNQTSREASSSSSSNTATLHSK